MTASSDRDAVSRAAMTEAAQMRAAVEQLEPGGFVRMTAQQFTKLAALIEHLATRGCCTDPDCFVRSDEGIRWWVPLPMVEQERRELSELRDICRQMSATSFSSRLAL